MSDGIAGFGTGLSTNGGSLVAPNEPYGAKYGSVNLLEQIDGFTPSFLLDTTQGSLPSGLTYTRTGGTTVLDMDSVLQQLPTNEAPFPGFRRVVNLYANSSVLVTQGNATQVGTYVASFSGTGTVVFSGSASGTLVGQGANVRVAITLTTTAGTLTSTVTGSCTSAQLENKTNDLNQSPGEYVSTGVTTSATNFHGTGVDGSQNFPYRNGNVVQQNLIWPSATYATQTIAVTSGQYYTLLHSGTGSITLSGGATGATTSGTPLKFLTTSTTLTLTVTGSVLTAQLNPGELPATYVATTSAAVNTNIVNAGTGAAINTTLLGYKNWPSRVNSIRNNTMVGGGAGTLPTNWSASTGTVNGLTVAVVGVGTENGIPYTELSFSGTPSSTFQYAIFFESNTQIAASAGQFWTASQFTKLSAGTTANVTTGQAIIAYASGSSVGESNPSVAMPTAAGLGTQRSQQTWTAPATTTSMVSVLTLSFTNGQAVNFNIRIGAPQLEQVTASTDVASDVILTSGSAVTLAEGYPSQASAPTGFNALGGTMQAQYVPMQSNPNTVIFGISDGTTSNVAEIRDNSGAALGNVTAQGTGISPSGSDAVAVGAVHKTAVSWSTMAFAQSCTGGGTVHTGTTDGAPTGINAVTIGGPGTGAAFAGIVQKTNFYPQTATAVQMQSIST